MPASIDGNVGGKRLGNDHDEETTKRQRRDESPGSDIWDDSYVATLDIGDVSRPILTRGRLGGNQMRRKDVGQEVDDDEDDGVVAEEPRNIHYHAVNLVREYREPEKIVPIDGTTQVIIIGNFLFRAAQNGRANLAETILGLSGLPHTAWMDERMATIPDAVVTSVVAMLCTISSRLIYHLVLGQVPQAMLVERAIDKELQSLMASGDTQPAIYANFVVDSRGRGPSPDEWADVITALYRYMESEQFSDRIDSIYPGTRVAGAKKYLSSAASIERNLPVCQDRVTVLVDFITAMEQRMGDSGPADERMKRPLCEVGYSSQPITRMRAHAGQRSSNYLMGVCMAVLEDQSPEEFRLSQHIILHVYEEQDAALGETFVSAMLQAYTVNGGGFSHAAAGTSIESIKRTSDDSWKKFRLALANDDRYLRRMSTETAQLTREAEAANGRQDVTSELAEEEKKREAMWDEIGKMAPEIERRAVEETELIRRMRDAFL